MLKLYFYLLLILLGCSCQNVEPLRGWELTQQLDSISLQSRDTKKQIDSLVNLSAGLSAAERYAVLCHVIRHYLHLADYEAATRYLRLADSMPFPEVTDKATGFLILHQYENADWFCDYAPQLIQPDKLASLFFNMENRWHLTPEEKCRLLVIKSDVYFNVFREYKSAATIATQAVGLVTRLSKDSLILRKMYGVLYQSCIRSQAPEENIALSHKFLAETELDSSSRNTINHLLASLYLKQKNYRKSYQCLQEAGCMNAPIYNSIVPQVYMGLDSIPAALAYIGRHRRSNLHEVIQGVMIWDEARARLQDGDTARYERCVAESVAAFDRFPSVQKEVDACSPSVAYVHILRQQGRDREAIDRMKLVCRRLQSWHIDFTKVPVIRFEEIEMNLYHQRLMIDYLQEAGCLTEAWKFKWQYDSLQNQFARAQYRAGQQKAAADMYTADLQRNLEMKAAGLATERRHFLLAVVLLAMALLSIGILVVLHRARIRKIDQQYALRKETERLKEEQLKEPVDLNQLPADEQLFRKIEEQFHSEQLFRNPGFCREDFCRLGGSNQMYISSCINKYAGMNINQWINQARIDYAIELIHHGEKDLVIIAESSGFASMRSFFRSFKQYTNLTPRQYIARERET